MPPTKRPPCGLNQTCNSVNGRCTSRSASCFSDADCAGYFASQSLPAPHCNEGTCSACTEAVCHNGCTDEDCADAGLTCLRPNGAPDFCGLPCSAPSAPPCPVSQPWCDVVSGFCGPCTSDDECPSSFAPTCAPSGFCACTSDSECPHGLVCFPRGTYGNCAAPVSGCEPQSCPGFCDWQTGICVSPSDDGAQCIADYDCTTLSRFGNPGGDFCVSGKCVECRDNNDCRVASQNSAPNSATYCCLAGDPACGSSPNMANTCVDTCRSNADCAGNSDGPFCMLYSDAGYGQCEVGACASDADCGHDPSGPYCDFDGGNSLYAQFGYGTCGCRTSAECAAGQTCVGTAVGTGFCTPFCYGSPDCAPGYFCDPGYVCRPRCDDGGGTCSGADPICDIDNLAHQNGEVLDGSVPGLEWCYACLTSDDCPGGQGCIGDACVPCKLPADCVSGACLPTCDARPCPAERPICAQLIAFSNEHKFCFGCLDDSDCADAGPGAWCDTSVAQTFTCQLPVVK